MIRGHVDFVSRTRIEGWLYSERLPLSGARVLAFEGDDCVGAGRIEVFREDLHRAGLGDGIAGFSFFIQLKPDHNPRTVHVQLEGSDLVLRQVGSLIAPPAAAGYSRRGPRAVQTLSWMLGCGWLTQGQYDALRLLGQFGAYRQSLRGASDPTQRLSVVGALLQLHAQMDVIPEPYEELWGEDLAPLGAVLEERFPGVAPVIALWAPWTTTLNYCEASHLESGRDDYSGIDYDFGDDVLLWLNLDGDFHVPTGGFTCPITAYLPARR
jgi:hypothetical protein